MEKERKCRAQIPSQCIKEGEVKNGYNIIVIDHNIQVAFNFFSKVWTKVVESIPDAPREVTFINLFTSPNALDWNGRNYLNILVQENHERFTLLYSPFLRISEFDASLQCLKKGRRVNTSISNNSILGILEENQRIQHLTCTSLTEGIPPSIKNLTEITIEAWERSKRFTQYEQNSSLKKEKQITAGIVMIERAKPAELWRLWNADLYPKFERNSSGDKQYVLELGGKVMEETKKFFPNISNDIISALSFMKEQSEEQVEKIIPPQLQNKVVKGLFVDTVGALLEDVNPTKIRPDIAQKINEESQKRHVYMWTDGDYKKLVHTLNGLHASKELNEVVPLPKQLFSGLTVEETIDVLSQNQLLVDCHIKALKHQKIQFAI